ncbi:MAG: MAPEG family protein [Hyphomicrobiales bacterium]|nr:MAPEG family protein [Hyphomicrobiales bacterium]
MSLTIFPAQPPIMTALIAGLLGLFFIRLAMKVIAARRAAKVSIGDSDDRALLRASRVHANFAEYVPLTLILMALAENIGAPWFVILLLGVMLIAGRLLHAHGLGQEPDNFRARVRGMQLTIFALAGASAVALIMAFMAIARGIPA